MATYVVLEYLRPMPERRVLRDDGSIHIVPTESRREWMVAAANDSRLDPVRFFDSRESAEVCAASLAHCLPQRSS